MFLDPTPKSAIWTTQWKTWLNNVWEWITGTKWYTPTLLNSWADFDSAWTGARYRKISGMVEIQGMIAGGTATGGTDLFILPEGFRPAKNLLFPTIISGTVLSRIDVLPTGTVELGTTASSTWTSLNGIMFKAEQ
jgi:hypothetical protein